MSPLLTRVSNSQGISGLSGFRRVFIGRRGVGGYAITRSLRFNSSDSAYLNFTPETAGNRKTWTWSGWVKKTEIISSGDRQLFGSDSAATNEYNGIAFLSTNKLNFRFDDASTLQIRTTAVYRDASAWMHIVCAADTTQSTASDRLKMYVNGVEITDFDSANYPSQNAESSINSTQVHEIGRRAEDGSQYFNGYLADVHFIDGQALAATDFGEFDGTGIWNPKQYSGSFGTNGFHLDFSDNSSTINLGTDTSVTVSDAEANKGMDVVTFTANGGTNRINGLRFAPDFVWLKSRSSAANHEIFDSVRGSSAILFPNNTGTETTDSGRFASFNSDGFTLLGGSNANGSGTSVAWCWKAGGPAVTNTDGTINSQVSANQDYGFSVVTYSGSGVNADSIGHGLPSAPSFFIIKARNKVDGWRVYHSATGTGNILELNSSNAASSASNWQGVSSTTISLQNDSAINGSGYNYVGYLWSEVSGFSKFGSYSGTGSSGNTIDVGFRPRYVIIKRTDSAGHWLVYDSARGNGLVIEANNAGTDETGKEVSFTSTGFSIDNTDANDNASGGTYIYAAFASEPGNNWALNNFVANDTLAGFKAVTYTGNQSTQTISGVGFSPSLVWIKNRDAVKHHALLDVVRGGDKVLQSQSAGAEATASNFITSFNTNGFTIGNDSAINGSGNGIVAWCWDAGSTTETNNAGSIETQVRANADLGFSIVTYTGNGSTNQTIGHGLGTAPDFVLFKRRDSTGDWLTYHRSIGNDKYLWLNSANAAVNVAGVYDTSSTTLTIQEYTNYNATSGTYVAYCFTSKPGVSAFGSYTGNGNATGPVVTTGFEPAFLLVKRTDTGGSNWMIYDSARSPSNPRNKILRPNESSVENVDDPINFLTDGFQPTSTAASNNASGGTYIYMAFASLPSGAEIDSLLDSPTIANTDDDTGAGGEVSGNYCTWNPLDTLGPTFSNGNLEANYATSAWRGFRGTVGVSSGKWYYEATCVTQGTYMVIGVAKGGTAITSNFEVVEEAAGYAENGPAQSATYGNNASYGTSFGTGDTVGVALDVDNGTLTFYVNGVSQGTAYSNLTAGTWFPAMSMYGSTHKWAANFGQRPFQSSAPTGYQPWTTALFDDPTIADGSTAVGIVTYSGASSNQSITGINYSPDFVWIKERNGTNYHMLFDTVRGANVRLNSNSTNADYTETTALTSFDTNGFSVGANDFQTNTPGSNYVAWTWYAGGAPTTDNIAGAGNVPTAGSVKINGANSTTALAGSIAATRLSANTSAGFSIVGYTGTGSAATVGHGLTVDPGLLIIKRRDSANQWTVYFKNLWESLTGNFRLLQLNENYDAGTNISLLNSTQPTSTVFSVGTDSAVNASGGTYVAYCWAPVEGYSAFGTYEGTGTSDGAFCFTGFKPRYLLLKNADGAFNWKVIDSARSPYNFIDEGLSPNTSSSETSSGAGDAIDFVSNGFKIRAGSSNTLNQLNSTFIWAAFAEHPFKNARAR